MTCVMCKKDFDYQFHAHPYTCCVEWKVVEFVGIRDGDEKEVALCPECLLVFLEATLGKGWNYDMEKAPKNKTLLLTLESGSVVMGVYGPKRSRYGVNCGDAWGFGFGWDDHFRSQPYAWRALDPAPLRGEK